MKYEQIITELENISTKLEDSETSLSDAVDLFEKSVTLAKQGYDILSDTAGKITVLKKELDGFKEKPIE